MSSICLSLSRVDGPADPSAAAPVINYFYGKSRSLFNSFSEKRYTTVESSKKDKNIVAKVRDADGFVDLCEIWNDGDYKIEEHVVQTGDGYLLGLHRVVKKTEDELNGVYPRARVGRAAQGEGSVRGNGGKKVAYLHHGWFRLIYYSTDADGHNRTLDEQRGVGLPVGQGTMPAVCACGEGLRRLGNPPLY